MKDKTEIDSIEVIPSGYIQLDGQNRITKWNRWMESHTGYVKKDTIGVTIESLYPDEVAIGKSIERVRNSGGQPVILSQLMHSYFLPIKLGGQHISGHEYMQQECCLILLAGAGGPLAITISDVTSSVVGRQRVKKMQIDLKEAREAARESTKEKSEFLAMMSHEIRTPMNAVIGFTDILMESSLDPLQLDYVNTIQKSGTRLLRLLSDLLDFSKLEANRIELHTPFFDLQDCIEDTSRLAEKLASDKGLEYSWKAVSKLPIKVKGDAGRLTQVLLNLLNNSIKFTDTGRVQLSVKSTITGSTTAELQFSVTDTGPGIPEEQRNRLFKAFSQVDSQVWHRHGGTGLGLAISKKLIELMGGKIWIEPSTGIGVTFSFTFPVELNAAESRRLVDQSEEPEGKEPPVESLNILLVEDNPLNRKLTAAQLKKLGHRSVFAQDGREGIRLLELEDFDLVIMDLQMPVMDGYEASRRIRAGEAGENNRNLPIIAVSADASSMARERCAIAGMNDYFSKPIKMDTLKNAIEIWCSGKNRSVSMATAI